MPATRDDLSKYLDRLGISVTTVDHPPVFTVEEAQALRGAVVGGHSKNLFLKDKKDALFLVVAREDAAIDLRHLHGRIGARGGCPSASRSSSWRRWAFRRARSPRSGSSTTARHACASSSTPA
jgi:hypothetical protein